MPVHGKPAACTIPHELLHSRDRIPLACASVPARRSPAKGWSLVVPKADPGCKIRTHHKLADTGCGHDLIASQDLRPIDLAFVVEGGGTYLQTANGVVHTKQQVPLQVTRLGEVSYPYLLQSTPDVLRVGYRCQAEGYGYGGHHVVFSLEKEVGTSYLNGN